MNERGPALRLAPFHAERWVGGRAQCPDPMQASAARNQTLAYDDCPSVMLMHQIRRARDRGHWIRQMTREMAAVQKPAQSRIAISLNAKTANRSLD